jgi:hypothetical protein
MVFGSMCGKFQNIFKVLGSGTRVIRINKWPGAVSSSRSTSNCKTRAI